jgi:acetylornithine deacetylase/succinyl-diaminopimelate desuccinylase-like protein
MEDVLGFLDRNFDRTLADLMEICRIPSISTSLAHRDDVERCAYRLQHEFVTQGAYGSALYRTAGHPVVFGEWRAAREDAPTVLVYGHYDVQPPEPLEAWTSPPFEPMIRDGYLYGRGTVDDKGQVFMHIAAIRAYLATRGALPVNLKFLIEGEEEAEDSHLEIFLAEHRDELAADVVVVSDTAMIDDGVPTIGLGMRGLCYLEVAVQSMPAEVHSGTFGGAVLNSANALCRMIASLQDHYGRIVIHGFYDKVRATSAAEREELAALAVYEERYRTAARVAEFSAGEWSAYSPLERLWRRPTFDVNGICSGFTDPGVKTIIPASATAKISMRLVPDQDPDEIAEMTERHLRLIAPPSVAVTVKKLATAKPYLADRNHPAVAAAKRALYHAFGREAVFGYEGGSIPFLQTISDVLRKPCILFGFGLPDEQSHAPNERLLLHNFRLGMKSCALLYEELGRTVFPPA